jgi:ribosomal-protein-serine acetyltransferase
MRIHTEKGWLESLSPDHAQELFDLVHTSRNHLQQWLPWLKRIHTIQDMRAFIMHLLDTCGPQFVIIVAGQPCGGIGFYSLIPSTKIASLGYWLGSEFASQGIMRDAVMRLCQFGFGELNLRKIEIRCAVENVDSRKVPEHLQFLFDGIRADAEWMSDQYVDQAMYSILRAEFEALYPADLFSNVDCDEEPPKGAA